MGIVSWVGEGGEISFVSIVGTVGIGGITSGLSLAFFVHVLHVRMLPFSNILLA